jgi:hypothetical protein
MPGTFVVALALWLTPAPGPVDAGGVAAHRPTPVAAATADLGLTNLAERPNAWRGQEPRESACGQLIARMCEAAGPQFCALIRREAERRPMTERDEEHCREVLEDRGKLEELLRSVRRI